MKTQAHYRSTIPMSDIVALLVPIFEEQIGDADIDPDDVTLIYDKDAETFTVEFELEWETDMASESSTPDFEFEAEIEEGERLGDVDLDEAVDGDRSKWPKVGQEVVLVNRDGVEITVTVTRIDSDGETFVDLDGEHLSVTNFRGHDEYNVGRIAFVRWSSIS